MVADSTTGRAKRRSRPHAAKHPVFRSVKLLGLLTATTLIVALIAFGALTWRGIVHFSPLQQHIEALTRLQQTGLRLEALTIRGLKGDGSLEPEIRAAGEAVATVMATGGFLSPATPERLAKIRATLAQPGDDPRSALFDAVKLVRQVLAAETSRHETLLGEGRRDLTLEFTMIGAAVLVLGGLGMLTLFRMRGHVFGPLNTLEQLLDLLARREYSLARTENVDPIVRPLTASYNHLVSRLITLEKENARHRDTLEREVRTATGALLEQQRELAVAERLAATGEIAARIAHELRNPLAGMQMALANIRVECGDRQDVVGRLDLVIDELRRVTGLLNGLLDQSRTSAETAVDLDIDRTVEDLFAILRYQIPGRIALRRDIPDNLVCRLPRDRLRQMLLNLALNSAAAIGERDGVITIGAALTADETLKLTVTDNGPGFPQDMLRDGVGTFRSLRPGGTGLGLSIVSRHLRNLEGGMELRNLKPHGACVTLTLPCKGSNV